MRVDYFRDAGCATCERIEREILPLLERSYPNRFRVVTRDIAIDSNVTFMFEIEARLGLTNDNRLTYLVLDQRYAYGDLDSMRQNIVRDMGTLLEERSRTAARAAPVPAGRDLVVERMNRFTLPAVIGGGLVDGINPCVFSTLVFFMSVLAVARVRGRALLTMGASFCAASFLTYTALGFGLLRTARFFTGYRHAREALDLSMVAVLAVFAWLSVRDAWRYARSGRAEDVMLQLPDGLKRRIRSVMRKGVGLKNLVLGGFAVGSVVTLLESVCTGQVYVPVLAVIITRSQGQEGRAWAYLLLYNAMFIVPLVAVFLLTYFGIRMETLLQWSQRNVVASKLALAALFVCLGALILLTR